MKNLMNLIFATLILSTALFTSCKEDNDVKVNAFGLMTDYMKENNLDLGNIIGDKTASPSTFFATKAPASEAEIADWAAKFYIMDIRSSDDFASGHITGAENVPFTNILTEADNATKPILVVCYSGQSACYATSLLRLYGHSTAKALKWGMSSWNETFANHPSGWNNGIGNEAKSNLNWITDAAPNNMVFNHPSISSTSTDGLAILKERVEAVVAGKFKGVKGTDVLTKPEDYHINNFFPENDYTGFGHFNNAYRIKPLTISNDEIKYLNPEETVVTYCYTGQTSAIITAYLRVLGYDAVSMKNGVNGVYNSHTRWNDIANQWGGDSNPHNYPTVQ
ncbi:rhodanese-like domain-containing protein [Labilibacter sediminis]|nr:rhodanese-like domain-containing protein [Labilibacter sediminis]